MMRDLRWLGRNIGEERNCYQRNNGSLTVVGWVFLASFLNLSLTENCSKIRVLHFHALFIS